MHLPTWAFVVILCTGIAQFTFAALGHLLCWCLTHTSAYIVFVGLLQLQASPQPYCTTCTCPQRPSPVSIPQPGPLCGRAPTCKIVSAFSFFLVIHHKKEKRSTTNGVSYACSYKRVERVSNM